MLIIGSEHNGDVLPKNCKCWFVFGAFVMVRLFITERSGRVGEDCFIIRGVAASKLGSDTGFRDWVYCDRGVCHVSTGVLVHVG